MIGWINLSVQAFICKTFGEDAWNKIVAESGVQDCGWVSSCPYPDKITYDLVVTGARVLGVTVEQALEAYGVFFMQYVTEQGYTKLLKTLGSNIVEFLNNLNNLHLHLSSGQPAMNAPAFRVDNVTNTSCHLHYQSKRPGLWPIVVGVLKNYGQEYLKYDVRVTLLSSRADGHDHEVFLVEYPEQPLDKACPLLAAPPASTTSPTAATAEAAAAATAPTPAAVGSGFTLSSDEFMRLFPFHMLLDKQCNLLQFGGALPKLVPGIEVGKPLAELFTLRHPHAALSWEGILGETQSSYVLQVPSSGLEFKGQMIPTSQPVPGCPCPKPVMLFLGSPRVANLDDMLRYGLFLSDIPLHDLSRDFVLLAEQRQAEADLKEKFEKLTLELKAEKQRSDALVQRMSGLLACFPFKDKGAARASATGAGGQKVGKAQGLVEDGPGAGGKLISTAIHDADERFGRMEVIEAVRRTLNSMNLKQAEDDQIQIIHPIGEGTYGKVYRGLWQQSEVAIKTIVLPAGMSSAQKREKMAIMEAAISSSLSHPNIVQTYTYTIRPLRDSAVPGAAGGGAPTQEPSVMREDASLGMSTTMGGTARAAGAIHSYEVRLVLELCEKGSLRDALEQGAYVVDEPSTGAPLLNYAAVLETAMDIAKACIHLHRNNVLHSDLKARNVLLCGSGANGRGVIAKVSDFGFAIKLPSDDCTHVSGVFQGTLTHCAPEVLLAGRVSKASDVYAYGVLLWELYTGDHAFKGVPKQLLGHQVSVEHRRPEFPAGTPANFKQLAQWCWNKDVPVRPTFEEVLNSLIALRKELGGTTPPLRAFTPGFASAAEVAAAAAGVAEADNCSLAYGPPAPGVQAQPLAPIAASEAHQSGLLSARLPQLGPTVQHHHSVSFQPSDSESDSDGDFCHGEEDGSEYDD